MIDMTKGSEIKILLRFMIPMLIGNLFQQVYNMVDSVIAQFLALCGTVIVSAVRNLVYQRLYLDSCGRSMCDQVLWK